MYGDHLLGTIHQPLLARGLVVGKPLLPRDRDGVENR